VGFGALWGDMVEKSPEGRRRFSQLIKDPRIDLRDYFSALLEEKLMPFFYLGCHELYRQDIITATSIETADMTPIKR
jgi:hypothetical protein